MRWDDNFRIPLTCADANIGDWAAASTSCIPMSLQTANILRRLRFAVAGRVSAEIAYEFGLETWPRQRKVCANALSGGNDVWSRREYCQRFCHSHRRGVRDLGDLVTVAAEAAVVRGAARIAREERMGAAYGTGAAASRSCRSQAVD